MRLLLCTVICCCVFTTVLPLVKGDTEEPSTTLKKRFKEWLQNYMKRDPHNSPASPNEQSSDVHVGSSQDGDTSAGPPTKSFGVNVRSKRSSGCHLSTCLVHDIIHSLHKMNNNLRSPCAPKEKIGRDGYGRRRRRHSLEETTQPNLQSGKQTQCNKDAFKVNLATELEERS